MRRKVSITRCPGGHKLPKEGCSPLYCIDGDELPSTTALAKVPSSRPSRPRDGKEPVMEAKREAQEALSFAVAREEARRALVPAPNLEGAEAEEYIEKKKVALLPVAIAEIETQLRFGDDKARIEAARDVLRMNGMLNRDAPTGVTPTIIINMGDKPQFPWLKRAETEPSEGKLVDGGGKP